LLTEDEMAGLYTACDVLVHPYRGEGFGLPILEAMACGLPVIVTNGGAALDFCAPPYAFLVDATRKPLGTRVIGKLELVDEAWCFEPDPQDLAAKMRRAWQNRNLMTELGQLAQQQAHANWSWAESGKKIIERIDALKKRPIRRQASGGEETGSQQAELETLKNRLQGGAGNIEELSRLTELYLHHRQTGEGNHHE
jgi:glycosyltransferase involved in cell wall biosynthesis